MTTPPPDAFQLTVSRSGYLGLDRIARESFGSPLPELSYTDAHALFCAFLSFTADDAHSVAMGDTVLTVALDGRQAVTGVVNQKSAALTSGCRPVWLHTKPTRWQRVTGRGRDPLRWDPV